MPDPEKAETTKQRPSRTLLLQLLASAIILVIVIWYVGSVQGILIGLGEPSPPKPELLEEGTWRFIVSGDSRNCGDVVMPAIAANALERFQPAFYWHLGDLRAIYKIDEDMAAAAQKNGQHLSCESYLKRAWPDFIEHQIVPF